MGVRRLEDLRAYRYAREFKLEVYRLVRQSRDAQDDRRFKSQLFEAAASNEMNIAEGFRRFGARDFCRFLTMARASLEEATRRLQDGVDRGYFTKSDCTTALRLAEESGRSTMALRKSLQRFIKHPAPHDPKDAEPRTGGPDK